MRWFCLTIALCILGCDDDSPTEEPSSPPEAPATAAVEATPAPAEETAPTEAAPSPRAPGPGAPIERAPAADRSKMREYRRVLSEARVAHRAGDSEHAIERYRAAVDLDPGGRALCELGWILFRAGHEDEARVSLSRGLAALPTEDPVPAHAVGPVGACLYNMGRLEESAGHGAEARRRYERSLQVRPGNRVVHERLRALPAPAAPTPTSSLPACGEGAATFDVDDWAARTRSAASSLSSANARLAELGLRPVLGETFVDWQSRQPEEFVLEITVRVESMRRAEGHARVVVTELSQQGIAFRVAVLLDTPEGTCRAGQLEEELDMCSFSCLSDARPFRLDFVPLVSENVDALRLRTTAGACACGSSRGSREATIFYGVEGDALTRYLGVPTYSAWYNSPVPPATESSSTLVLSDSFPRTITVTTEVSCTGGCSEDEYTDRQAAIDDESDVDVQRDLSEELGQDCGFYYEPCTASSSTLRHRYTGSTYSL